MEQHALIIVGPTAVGKTKLSVQLAQKYNGEILSADSMQIYRGMDIGTAKATMSERQGIPHYGIDIVNPDVSYTVAEFQRYARRVLTDIADRNKLPIVVGGTGLYVKSLIDPLDFTPAEVDLEYRTELYRRAERDGSESLHRELLQFDPLSAKRVHPNDLKRIVRALEVYHATGVPMSEAYLPEETDIPLQKFLQIGLTMSSRASLYNAINRRVDQMIADGLVEEVESLWKLGLDATATSMQAIGYKEITAYLRGQSTLDEAIELVKQNSRRLAKRQLSWFRRDSRVHWIYTDILSWERVVENADGLLDSQVFSD